MKNATEPTYTPLNSTDIELDIEDISYETPEEIPAKPIDPAYGNVLCIEDAPDYFDLDSFLHSSKKVRTQGQKDKTYGLPSVSILKDEVWHVMSVSGAIFDNLPRAWEKRKALHMQVKGGLVSISFSDTVNYVSMDVFQASSETPYEDLVGFSRRDIQLHATFSDDNYISIVKKQNGFHVDIFNELVPLEKVRFDYDEHRKELFDDNTYTQFSKVYTSTLKDMLGVFVPLTQIKTSSKGRIIGNTLYFNNT